MGDSKVEKSEKPEKPKNVLRIEPENELCFKGPFTSVVTSQLRLINTSGKKVCFKVKTTAPRRYCVRPNNGILAPKSSVDVILRLQPLDTPDTENTKHKFMVQSIMAPEENINSLDKLWRTAPPNQIMSTKLKCIFESPTGERLTNEEINRITVASTVPASVQPATIESRNGLVDDDVRRLRHEVERLRQENRALKEGEARLRKLTAKEAERPSVEAQIQYHQGSKMLAYPAIIYIVLALLLGLAFGKFIL